MSPEDLAEIWSRSKSTTRLERADHRSSPSSSRKKTTDHVHKILLDYLIRDEEKHYHPRQLEELKKHMSKLAWGRRPAPRRQRMGLLKKKDKKKGEVTRA